ncbi:uroporphyrinogen-III C-methyltransferase [Clostridium botulinum]|uniref:uroporphyrinogen-III C-methyltransferase n=1 Tax=Clostridium botulinum (strain Hall / ATCC 3502 / NCTC 13319 / Type A) TaxID=441771 RepID=A5I0B3_CLOBH|nr:uroporphyrinogen-III C-methyltransferase [Clostridium botulinum]ABS35022.1 uroporphyrinogen III synthase/methyltransferase [Clostridium botulinum A str. ATCC 19397]ABS36553.1 uroporphyrinogen III synthase/methyltransferase [Clostridium botulinum A str. Hall]AWB16839.1 uroporphyrinogen-III C-methyltransferase [Clostridium botulinum]EGT5614711.1 uroporphyrinogen-III C-methyltransferase [Clostridium botulinum]EGT5621864.1 uroporphyrinogen-III C-methyltransferase [Clostridium botulinum]
MSKVYLIGAGPGDEELITLKAIRALKKCTAVMYDRLANGELLKYLAPNCEIYYCGKEPGCHYKSQDEINKMLVKLAKEGHIVGRIKGGDPYVFGRGGEEALDILEENIEFEVIPGVTSPVSVLNYAGIPITHRGISRGFHIFTAMTKDKLDIDWKSVVNIGGTLVFLMGLGRLELITKGLIENGMDKEGKVAVVMKGTTSKQKKVIGNLENIVEKVKEAKLESPVIIVVGEVVSFSDKLNWYEKKPLFGRNICITRTKEQAKELKVQLLDLGAEVTEINSIEIKNTEDNLKSYLSKLKEYDYIALTSVNAVKIFFDYLIKENIDIRNINAKFAAIGPATSEAIRIRGIMPSIKSKHFVAESLFEEMRKHIQKGDKILVPRSKDARPFLVDALRKEGCTVDEVHIYGTLCGQCTYTERFEDADTVLFTSPSTVRNMISMVGIDSIKEKSIIAIGPITAAELDKNNIECSICDEYSINGIIDKLLDLN